MDKSVANIADAVAGIEDGSTIMIGGFGGSGAPIELIHALIDKGPKGLTVINNNAGNGRIGIAAMIDAGMVRKMICSFPRSTDPRAFTDRYLAGDIAVAGFTSIVASIWLLGGIMIFCIGITGLYVGRLFGDMKQRPYYIVSEQLNAPEVSP